MPEGKSLLLDEEGVRKNWAAHINANPLDRPRLEAIHGQVWDTEELSRDYDVHGFMAPLVIATCKATKKRGSLLFQHHPRFYFGFVKVATEDNDAQ
ncbi:MAG TPA: hypothetical protein PLT63_01190 [Syntrophales bacterium]|jgi:hypothetical protein|nr:hypothetical protein [Syntrophales bacterium]